MSTLDVELIEIICDLQPLRQLLVSMVVSANYLFVQTYVGSVTCGVQWSLGCPSAHEAFDSIIVTIITLTFYQATMKAQDKYKLLDKISEGAFGTVYNAIQLSTGDNVAIKQVFDSAAKDHKSPVSRQLRILKKLSHPNIIGLLDVQQKPFKVNLVLERCPYDINQLIRSLQYPCNKALIRYVFKQILEGVLYLHSQNILHRDLKPANILLTSKLEVKICDFGSAVQQAEKESKGEYDIEGFTKWYKAPEMLFGDRKYNTGVDIWSLGCVFAELLQGLPLFTANNEFQQLFRISELLGSPDKENWPGIVELPDYGKIMFNKKMPQPYERFFEGFDDQELDLLSKMLRYEGRASASQLLEHPYFHPADLSNPQESKVNWREKETNEPYYYYHKLIPK